MPRPKTDTQKQLAAELRAVHENALYGQITQRIRGGVWNGPWPERQFVFDPKRKFRADFAFVCQPVPLTKGLLVEVDGEGHRDPGTGLWVVGAHHRTKGRAADLERDARAMLAGWQVLRVSPAQVKHGLAVEWISKLIGAHP